jgi:hypothetical protein
MEIGMKFGNTLLQKLVSMVHHGDGEVFLFSLGVDFSRNNFSPTVFLMCPELHSTVGIESGL